jgi:hypothetical protein
MMPARNPRINVVIEDRLYEMVRFLAENEGVSLSAKVRDLIREALEVQEDIHLTRFAEARVTSSENRSDLSHEEVWA